MTQPRYSVCHMAGAGPRPPSCQLFPRRCLNCAALTDSGCDSCSPVDDSALNVAPDGIEARNKMYRTRRMCVLTTDGCLELSLSAPDVKLEVGRCVTLQTLPNFRTDGDVQTPLFPKVYRIHFYYASKEIKRRRLSRSRQQIICFYAFKISVSF